MATTKVVTAIFQATSVAASGTTTTAAVTIDDGYGAALGIKITNGATGPTVAGQCQIEVSQDNSEWFNFGGPLVGALGNNVITSWGGVDIPIGVEYLRLTAGSNTDQAVVWNADISEVTAV